MPFTESIVEDATLSWFAELDYASLGGRSRSAHPRPPSPLARLQNDRNG